MSNGIILKKYNGKEIDLCDEMTRYFLSMKDKNKQAWWMSKYLVTTGHNKQNISFEFESETKSFYQFIFSDNVEFNNPFIVETKDKYIDNVGIFTPGVTHYWKVRDTKTNEESDIDYFKPLNVPVRWISSGTVYNMRDLGGWETDDEKRVRYGFIYRGGQLKLDNQWEKSYMDDYSYQVFDYLGIKTEIELRGEHFHSSSQIHEDSNYLFLNGIGYENILSMTDEQKEQYRTLFKMLTNVDNYPLYFHCSWGADRTGVLAFLIEGILGVSYDNICEDYELTSLTGSGRRSRIDFPWKDMIPSLTEKYGSGKPLKDLLSEYLIDYLNIEQEDIDSIRKIMLEDNNKNIQTHTVTYRVNGEVYLESLVYDGGFISTLEPGISMDKGLDCWLLDGNKFDEKTPIHKDIVLDAKTIDIEYEDYDSLSLKDLGLEETHYPKEAKDYPYEGKSKNGSRVFSFKYKIESPDEKFDDGVHVEIGTLWDYKAHIWFQNLFFQYLYTNKGSLFTSFPYKFEYGKTHRIDVGVLIPKNGKNKGKKMFFFKIDDNLITCIETQVDLSIKSIGLAGTKGVLLNINN